jgi:hypothetical protein
METLTDIPVEEKVEPQSKKAAPTTAYVVLEQHGTEWSLVKKVKARSSTSAIREVAKDIPVPNTVLVAVPERSWNPVKVSVETKTQLKLT